MIRVALIMLAITQLPALTNAQAPASPQASKSVSDPYYAKRHQALSGSSDESTPHNPVTPASHDPEMAGSKDTTSPDPYYAARQAAAQNYASTYQRVNYMNNAAIDGSYEQVPAQQGEYFPDQYSSYQGYDPQGCGYPGANYGGGCSAPAGYGCCPKGGVLWNEVNSCSTYWARFEYLNWWLKGGYIPPLVTTSPPNTSQSDAGVLGEPGTRILFGDERVNGNWRPGGRITVGGWLVGGIWGIEGNYYALGTEATRFDATSVFSNGPTTDPILARPFFNPTLNGGLGLQDSRIVAFPGFQTGGVTVDLNGSIHSRISSDVQSAGLTLRRMIDVDFMADHRLFLTGGYRFFRLDEDLFISDLTFPVGGPFLPGTYLKSFDSFTTRNIFNGGDIGLLHDLRRGRFVLETQAKIALGNMREVINIKGESELFDGVSTTVSEGGLLAQPSNIGHYRRDQFVVIPELSVNLGFQVTKKLRAMVGYSITYVSRVARPGNEIDFIVDPSQTVPRPRFVYNPTDLWLQGINSGFEFRF